MLSVREVWKQAAKRLGEGRPVVDAPDVFETFQSRAQLTNLRELVTAYQETFRASAWQEDYPEDELLARLESELRPPATITIMRERPGGPVAGFCWAQILSCSEIVAGARGLRSFATATEQEWRRLLNELNARVGQGRVLFVHEYGIVPGRRGRGLDPLRFLIRPALCLAEEHNIFLAVWWTSRESEAYPLSRVVGFEDFAQLGGNIFMYHDDIRDFLTVILCGSTRELRAVLKQASQLA